MNKVIIVSKNPDVSKYNTIQEAITAIPVEKQKKYVIFIKPGIYNEKLHINKSNIILYGEDPANTIIKYDCSRSILKSNTSNTATCLIEADDIQIVNITFENTAGQYRDVGQAVAVATQGDRISFYNCRFLAYTNTLFAGLGNFKPEDDGPLNAGRQYYYKCFITGDFNIILGTAICFFEECKIECREDSTYFACVIAINAASRYNKNGYVFYKCYINGHAKIKTWLGQPFSNHSSIAYIKCNMENIASEGWTQRFLPELCFKNTARFIEFGTRGVDMSQRTEWSKTLPEDGNLFLYTKANVLLGWSPNYSRLPLRTNLKIYARQSLNALQGFFRKTTPDGMLSEISNSKTVIYSLPHPAFIRKALVHKFAYHPESEIIILTDNSFSLFPDGGKLPNGVKEVIKIDYYIASKLDDEVEAENVIVKYIEHLFIENNIDISCVNEIYCMNDMVDPVVVYLENKKIYYNCIEFSANQFFIFDTYTWSELTKRTQVHYNIQKKYKIFSSTGNYCKKRLLCEDTTKKIETEIEEVVFDFCEALNIINQRDKNVLLDFYGEIKLPNDYKYITLVALPNFTTISKFQNLSVKDIILSHQRLIDFYIGDVNNIALKPHPCIITEYNDLPSYFNNAPVIDANIPTELFPIYNIKVKLAIAVKTTALDILKRQDTDTQVDVIGIRYFKMFQLLNQLYFAFSLIKFIPSNNKNVFVYNIDIGQVSKFASYAFNDLNLTIKNTDILLKSCDSIALINGIEELPPNNINDFFNNIKDLPVVFVLAQKRITFNLNDYLEIKINKEIININTLEPMGDEFVYIICNNEETLNALENQKIIKSLKYTGVNLNSEIARFKKEGIDL
ncbi:MAG: pectinesterase family protein [Defluviitaleaceae bacterium]|nr:pectinesterase family protein [Defluviitaleaceae bacterium]